MRHICNIISESCTISAPLKAFCPYAAFKIGYYVADVMVGTTGFEPATPTPPAAVWRLPPVSGALTLDN